MQQPSPSHIAAPAEFVGRSAELRWLSRSLAEAQAGSPRVVVVVGEAGLGKSRLIEELSARARRAGTQVLSGRGEAIRQAYAATLEEHRDGLKSLARSAGWTYALHRTDRSLPSALMGLYTALAEPGSFRATGNTAP